MILAVQNLRPPLALQNIVISMKFDLATVALAFMLFTAKASASYPATRNPSDFPSEYSLFPKQGCDNGDVDPYEVHMSPSVCIDIVDKSSFVSFTIESINISDPENETKCYLWTSETIIKGETVPAGPPQYTVAADSGCSNTPGARAVACYRGVCPGRT